MQQKSVKLQSEAEQKLSAAQKDAALETLNAVAAKEREMNGQLLQLERENAKLQGKNRITGSKIATAAIIRKKEMNRCRLLQTDKNRLF